MSDLTLAEAMDDLSAAEDFLNFFGIAFDADIVHVNRLHIMQRFHDYLQKASSTLPDDGNEPALRAVYASLLARAYQDFVESDALTEKVFKVFKMQEPQSTFVPLEQLMGG